MISVSFCNLHFCTLLAVSTMVLCLSCKPDTVSSATSSTKVETKQTKVNPVRKAISTQTTTAHSTNEIVSATTTQLADDSLEARNVVEPGKDEDTTLKARGADEKKAGDKSGSTKPKKTSATGPAIGKSDIKFALIRHDFGTITEGDTVDYKFEFENVGTGPLEIISASASCGCTQPSYPFVPIGINEKGYVGVRYVSVGKEGPQSPTISVMTNASKKPVTLMMKGVVEVPEKEENKKEKEKEITAEQDTAKVIEKDSLDIEK